MDGNTSQLDVDGFFNRCIESGVRCVGLSLENEFHNKPIPEHVLDAGALFIRRASEQNLLLQFFLPDAEREQMEARFAELGVRMPALFPADSNEEKKHRDRAILQSSHAKAMDNFQRVEALAGELPEDVASALGRLKEAFLRRDQFADGLVDDQCRLRNAHDDLKSKHDALRTEHDQLSYVCKDRERERDDLEQDCLKLLRAEGVTKHKLDRMGYELASLEAIAGESQHALESLAHSRMLKLTQLLSPGPTGRVSEAAAKLGTLSGVVQELERARAAML
jgi:hypothetical protein